MPPETIEAVVCAIEEGALVCEACAKFGITDASLYRRSTPEQSERLKEASKWKGRKSAEGLILLAREALAEWRNPSGKKGDPAYFREACNRLAWDAEKRDPATFGNKQSVEMSGGVTVSRGPDVSQLTDAQLEALAAIKDLDVL